MKRQPRPRAIDQRYRPPVAGVDLEQSLNYIALADVDEKFIYDRYTAGRLSYVPGRRPALEAVARRVVGKTRQPMQQVQLLAQFVAQEVLWAGLHHVRTGTACPPNRAMDEESLILSGVGWCNEQARVFCALTQVLGIPSRLVFACNLRKRYGHVITEVLVDQQWMAVDQSFGLLFAMDGKPIRASQIWHDARCRRHFEPIYRDLSRTLIAELGLERAKSDFAMCCGRNPLDGFTDLGYHNHFIN